MRDMLAQLLTVIAQHRQQRLAPRFALRISRLGGVHAQYVDVRQQAAHPIRQDTERPELRD